MRILIATIRGERVCTFGTTTVGRFYVRIPSFLCGAILLTVFSADGAAQVGHPKPKITISKETTYITEPVRADGYVDYQAALNSRLNAGVTPENNAAVLMLKAVGTKIIDKAIRAKTLEALGAKDLTEDGEGLINFMEFIAKRHADQSSATKQIEIGKEVDVDEEEHQASTRPWSKEEFPRMADCLAANETALKTIEEASKRPFFCIPLTAPQGDNEISFANTGAYDASRKAAFLLVIRIMNRMQANQSAEAWQDAMVCLRLAKQFERTPSFTGKLVAQICYATTFDAMQKMALTEKLTAKQAKRFGDEMAAIPVEISYDTAWNVDARIDAIHCFLQEAFQCYRCEDEGMVSKKISRDTYQFPKSSVHQALKTLLMQTEIDWDEVLRQTNAYFDEINQERIKAKWNSPQLSNFKKITKTRAEAAVAIVTTDEFNLRQRTPLEHAQLFAEIHFGLLADMLTPDLMTLEPRLGVERSFARFSLGLAGYHAAHGVYPRELAELTPEFLPELPKDPFSEKNYIYKSSESGYVLYSVGPNGKDDCGKNYSINASEDGRPVLKDADDIAIRK